MVDKSDQPRILHATTLLEVDAIDLSDDSSFTTNTTYYGPLYAEDNSKVWMLIKKSLLGHQSYHHIGKFEWRCDGRGAWLVLKAYYEGKYFVNKTI